jgi:WD40 repeat protein
MIDDVPNKIAEWTSRCAECSLHQCALQAEVYTNFSDRNSASALHTRKYPEAIEERATCSGLRVFWITVGVARGVERCSQTDTPPASSSLLTRNERSSSHRPHWQPSIMDPNQPGQLLRVDAIKENLDAVNRLLARPAFLTNITPSRLPSQAASDSSLSPTRDEARLHSGPLSQHRHSHLNLVNLAATIEDALEHADLVSPLIQEPCADGGLSSIDKRVVEHLEAQFVQAHRAYAKMAAERSFQTFSHGHQDLVLAVDFNYFGTRMVTASSDHRLKVWDKKDESWTLVESWKAHDAEIVDVSAPNPV